VQALEAQRVATVALQGELARQRADNCTLRQEKKQLKELLKQAEGRTQSLQRELDQQTHLVRGLKAGLQGILPRVQTLIDKCHDS
jgi:GTP1/Obg family GTP-binding protein